MDRTCLSMRMWELGSDGDDPEWQTVETPFSTDLFEVVNTTQGPYAVGDSGVLAADRGDGWEIVTDAGPNASQNQLRSLAVTDDGKRLWFVGSSGALGCYDVETNRKSDYSFPREKTSTWESVAVSGAAGSEKVLAGNGSGEILPFTLDGFDVNWNVVAKPDKQGATMTDLAADNEGYGYGIDTSGNVFKTTKDDGWERVGINNAQEKFYGIWGSQQGRIYVVAGQGRLYRYDDSYNDWTPIQIAKEGPLHAFDMYNDQIVVLGDGGLMYQRTDGGNRWEKVHTPTEEPLNGLALGNPDIAVGTDGTVLRRLRGTTRSAGKSSDGDNFDGRGEIYDPDQTAPSESDSPQSQNQAQNQPQQNQSWGQSQPQDQNQSQQTQSQSQPQQIQDLNPTQQNQNQSQPQNQNQDATAPSSRAKPQGQDQTQGQNQTQEQDQNLLNGIKDKIRQLSDESQGGESDQGQSS